MIIALKLISWIPPWQVFSSELDQKDMHGDSPYNIMFGPDICGPGTKKVHVIFNYKGKNLLVKKDIRCKVCEPGKFPSLCRAGTF